MTSDRFLRGLLFEVGIAEAVPMEVIPQPSRKQFTGHEKLAGGCSIPG